VASQKARTPQRGDAGEVRKPDAFGKCPSFSRTQHPNQAEAARGSVSDGRTPAAPTIPISRINRRDMGDIAGLAASMGLEASKHRQHKLRRSVAARRAARNSPQTKDNTMIDKNSKNLPAEWQAAAKQILAAVSGEHMPLLKFKKTDYFIGDDKIPLDTRYVAYCDGWTKAWVKFVDGELIDKKLYRVVDGKVPPERDELGDLNQSEWEEDDEGEPKDPWTLQHYLPLEDVASGERYLFVSGSVGGRIAIEILCQRYARQGGGLPIVKLALGDFRTKKFGKVQRPDFPIVSWESATAGGGLVDVTPQGDEPPPWEPDDRYSEDDR
jgi:hypothetical protein